MPTRFAPVLLAGVLGLLTNAAFVAAAENVADSASGRLPVFDAHLHYNRESAARWSPANIVTRLGQEGIVRAAVTSMPPDQVLALYDRAPGRIVPLLGVYRSAADKSGWTQDAAVPERVAEALRDGPWRGIGELHLFAGQRHSAVFRALVDLAVQHRLPLLLHCDPAVIDSVYAYRPQARVVWAHAGAYPYPPLLRDYLSRYPDLYVDLSVRDARIAPDGTLAPEWERLLWDFPERFLVGVDTFSVSRWAAYDDAVARIRGWLDQLPGTIAERIAHGNAETVFGGRD